MLSLAGGISVSLSGNKLLLKGKHTSRVIELDERKVKELGKGIETGVDVFDEVIEGTLKKGKYSEAEIKNIINSLKGDGFKNNPLRQVYENEVAGLKAYGEELLASGI